MDAIFKISIAILQQARIELLKLDMEGMLRVNFKILFKSYYNFKDYRSSHTNILDNNFLLKY